jgi:hypothetical protein
LTGVFLLINALLPLLVSTLQNYKAISPGVGSLITGIEGAVSAAVSAIEGSGSTPSITATSLLSAIQAALAVLQTQTKISPGDLLVISAFTAAVQAGLAASKIAVVDPTQLEPVTPV